MNVSNLENRIQHNGRDVALPAQTVNIDDDESYDYHAAQLERWVICDIESATISKHHNISMFWLQQITCCLLCSGNCASFSFLFKSELMVRNTETTVFAAHNI